MVAGWLYVLLLNGGPPKQSRATKPYDEIVKHESRPSKAQREGRSTDRARETPSRDNSSHNSFLNLIK